MARRPPDDRDTVVEARRTRLGVGGESTRPTADLVGQVVGGYLIDQELGAGGMGTVYRGSHIDTHRVVAIKALHPHLMDEPALVERFRREARLAARLAHEHIAGVIELVQHDDGRLLIAFEYVDGEPLSSIMTMPLPPERALTLIRQLLLGLEHAHAAGLVHRDLKPENVLVEWRAGGDHARIVDFGIAILGDPEAGGERLTASGQLVGTPLYMAPEQALGDSIDHRADLFSLGVMVYEMFAGVMPFEGKPLDILTANLKKDPPPFARRVPGLIVDPLHEALCTRLMARDLRKRFSSARHALDVLDLIERDPDTAALMLGRMDVARALAVVSLPGVR